MIKHISDKDNYWVRVTWRKTVVPDGPRKTQRITNLSRDRVSKLYYYSMLIYCNIIYQFDSNIIYFVSVASEPMYE